MQDLTRLWTACSLTALSITGSLAWQPAPVQDGKAALYSTHLAIELLDLIPNESPGRESVARVAELTGVGAAALKDAEFFRVTAAGVPAWLCALPFGRRGEAMLVCTDDDGALLSGAVLDSDLDPVIWRRLFITLTGRPPLDLASARTHEELEATRERAAEGDGPDERLTTALFEQRTQMVEIIGAFLGTAARLQGGQAAGEELQDLAERFERFGRRAQDLSNLLGERADDYERSATRLAALMREAADAEAAGQSPMPFLGNARGSCSSCHDLGTEGTDLGWQARAMALRAELGIGNDYFKVGFDLAPVSDDPRLDQELATAARSGLLLLSALRQ